MNVLVTIYRYALKLLPVAYRDHYAEPMLQTLKDMMTDQSSQRAKWKVWLRTMLDLPITTAYQYAETGGITMNHAPNYAKRGTIASAVLLLPFVIIVILNSIHLLTKPWNRVGYLSVFIMPAVALLLNLVILGRLLVSHDLWPRLKNIKQFQNNWILFTVPLLAFAIVLFAFGHDKAHCLADSRLNNVVQCVRNS